MVASNILAKTEITKKEHILKQWCEQNLSNQAQSKSDFSERMLVKKKTEILDKSSRSKISLKINSASPDWCNRKLLIRWQRQKLREKAKWCEKSLRMIILESTLNVNIVIWQEKVFANEIVTKIFNKCPFVPRVDISVKQCKQRSAFISAIQRIFFHRAKFDNFQDE